MRVVEVTPGTKELENAKTIALMCRKGWRHVRGGAWCSTEMTAMPLPLARALASKPPGELPARRGNSAYEYRGQAISLSEDAAGFIARGTGPLALRSCPSNGVKTFTAETERLAVEAAETWVSGMDEGYDVDIDMDEGRYGDGECGAGSEIMIGE